MDRRSFLQQMGWGLGILAGMKFIPSAQAASISTIVPIKMSDSEWKEKLNPDQYHILRQAGTERAFSSPLYTEKREGVYICAGCDLPLFPSKFKYNSGTGWPSFFDALPNSIETSTDYKIGVARTEYHCARCGGHHGHVFNDGPKPTGLRYCNNGDSLKFIPDKS